VTPQPLSEEEFDSLSEALKRLGGGAMNLFWYARELYLRGRATEAKTLFDSVNERAPGRFRTESAAEYNNPDGSPISLDGSVLRKEEGYAFIRLIDLAVDVFASRADSARIDWDRIRSGSQVSRLTDAALAPHV